MNIDSSVSPAEQNKIVHPIHLYSFGSKDTSKGNILVVPDFSLWENASHSIAERSKAAEVAYAALAERFPVSVLLAAPDFAHPSHLFVEQLVSSLEEAKLKRLTLVGIRSGALLAMNLAAASRELIRRIALIEPRVQEPKREFSGFVLGLEKLIPFGLPLRSSRRESSLSTYAHRVRCPAVILDSATSVETKGNARLTEHMPNVIHKHIPELLGTTGLMHSRLVDELAVFVEVPAKRSQKNA